jgi:hypothetical protein
MNLDRRWLTAVGAVVALAGVGLTASPLHLVGAVVVVAGVALLGLAAPDYALLAVLVLFPLHPLATRVAQFDFGVTGTALLVFSAWKEVALAAAIGSQLIRHVATHRDLGTLRPQLQVVDAVAAALAVLLVLGLALNPTGLALNQFRLWLFPLGIYVAVRLSTLTFNRFLDAAAVAVVAIGGFLVVQSNFFGWGFVSRYWTAAGAHVPYTFIGQYLDGPRGSGTLASPNEAALALAIWACMLVAAVLLMGQRRRWHALALGVVLVALAVTFSRSGAAAVLVGVVVIVVAVGRAGGLKPRQGLAWLLVAVVSAGLVSGAVYLERGGVPLIVNTFLTLSGESDNPDTSTVAHGNSLAYGVSLMEANPTGVGLGEVGARKDPITGEHPPYIVESYYLTMGVTFGWVGFAWAVLMPLAFLLTAVRAIRRGLLLAGSVLLGATLAAAVVSVLLPTMAEPQVAMLPWALAAFAGAGASVRLSARPGLQDPVVGGAE